jgi:formate/nitrite transporter FocA (FNT family)
MMRKTVYENVELTPGLNPAEREEVQHRLNISHTVVHETVRVEGERELHRSLVALLCSLLAAGLSMGFSLVGRGVIHDYLPQADWHPLVRYPHCANVHFSTRYS